MPEERTPAEKTRALAKTRGQKIIYSMIPDDPTFGRNLIMQAAIRHGGIRRFVEWIGEDPKNEYAFWTKIAPKLVFAPKEQAESSQKSIVDILRELDDSLINVTPSQMEDDDQDSN